MLKITICVGSSCSVHGSDELAIRLEELIAQAGATDQVELVGAFCMEQCGRGVSIRVGDRKYSRIQPADATAFFADEILPNIASREPL